MHRILVELMKRIVFLTYFMVLVAISAAAQTYGTHHKGTQYDQTYVEGFQTQDGSGNLSPIGATAVPSIASTTYDEVIDINPNGPNRDFINPTNPGDQSDEYPIGEPTILFLFALMMAGGIAIKRRIAVKR